MNLTINPRLLVIKAHYFLFFAAISCLMPFLPVYVQKLGLTKADLSIIYFIMPLSTIVAKPMCGNLADWLRRHKLIFLANLILTAVSYFGISFFPNLRISIDRHFNASLSCDRTNLTLCPSEPFKCRTNAISCNITNYTTISLPETQEITCTSLVNASSDLFECNSSVQCQVSCENEATVNYFLLYFCMVISAMAVGVSIALADTIAFHLSTIENVSYGISRLWGSIGWGLFAIITGYVYTQTDFGQVEEGINPVFYIFIAICAADVAVCTQLRIGELPKPRHMLKNLTGVLRKPFFILYTTAVFVMGLMTGALWTFQMVYVEELGGSPLLFGFIMGVQCFLGELPMFIISDWLLKKIGDVQAMPVCVACFAIRYVSYSFLGNPWFILPLELLNGVTFGLFFAGIVSFASINAPPGMSATMQGIEQGVYEGFGLGFGSLISGQMYEHFGGRNMYLYLGISAACFVFVYEVCVFILNRFDPNLRNEIELRRKVSTEEIDSKTEIA